MGADGFRLGDGFGITLGCGHPEPELEWRANGDIYCKLCGEKVGCEIKQKQDDEG